MNPSEQTVVVQFFVGVALLLFAYGFMYRRTKVDRFREDIFTLRDEVFDHMWKHGLDYSHPAYLLTRDALNGGIRLADRLNIGTFLLLAYHVTNAPRSNQKAIALNKSLATLAPEHRQYFIDVRNRAWCRMMRFLFAEGPFGAFCKMCRSVLNGIGKGGGRMTDAISSKLAEPFSAELIVVGTSKSRLGRRLFGAHHS